MGPKIEIAALLVLTEVITGCGTSVGQDILSGRNNIPPGNLADKVRECTSAIYYFNPADNSPKLSQQLNDGLLVEPTFLNRQWDVVITRQDRTVGRSNLERGQRITVINNPEIVASVNLKDLLKIDISCSAK